MNGIVPEVKPLIHEVKFIEIGDVSKKVLSYAEVFVHLIHLDIVVGDHNFNEAIKCVIDNEDNFLYSVKVWNYTNISQTAYIPLCYSLVQNLDFHNVGQIVRKIFNELLIRIRN